MKTKNAVKPRHIHRTVLNAERPELFVSRVEDAIIRLLDGQMKGGREQREGCEKFHMDVDSVS